MTFKMLKSNNINIRANDNLSLSIDGSTGTANQLLVTDGSKLKWDSMKPEVDLITGNPSYMFITTFCFI